MSGPASGSEPRLSRRAGRVLAALSSGGHLTAVAGEGDAPRYEVRVAGDRAPRLVADAALIEEMRRRDWLSPGPHGGLAVTPAGRSYLARQARPDEPFRAQHLALSAPDPDGPARDAAAMVDNESPLTWLRRRHGRNGQPLISETQYQAGERLRRDFTRAQMTPRVTADWSATARRRSRGERNGDPASFVDAAIAARTRLERALAAVGPELGGLLLDVCCLLNGLEDAERARAWPRRSGKVVLGIALDRLAAHYGLAEVARGRESAPIVHWGAAGYRPEL